MSDDPNLESIRAAYEPWSRGDFDTAAVFHEQIEFVTDMPERRVHKGHEQMGIAWDDFTSVWNGFAVSIEQIVPLDDGRYLVLVKLSGRGLGSDLPVEQAGANIVGLEDGLIKRFELYFERERGVAAASKTE